MKQKVKASREKGEGGLVGGGGGGASKLAGKAEQAKKVGLKGAGGSEEGTISRSDRDDGHR